MFSIPFEPSHLKDITARDYERRFTGEIMDLGAWAEAAARYRAISFVESDILLGSAGVIDLHQGVGEVWLFLSPRFPVGRPNKAWGNLTRALQREIASLPHHRLQTAIPIDFEAGHGFARHLGFQCEGVMRGYGFDKSDYRRFARIV